MRTLAVILVLACSGSLAAQDEKQIQDAIRGLGSDNFEERETATANLKKIGSPALEALRKAAASSEDPEVRARAQRLVDEIAKPPVAPKAVPGRPPVFQGSRLSIRTTKEGSVYGVHPTDGEPIELLRRTEGGVKLTYPDGKGGKAEAESASIDKFVEEHKELAAKYGITKDGIDYGGSKLSFSWRMPTLPEMPRLPVVPLPAPAPEFPNLDELFGQNEELRKAFDELRQWRRAAPGFERFGRPGLEVIRGALLSPVPDVLRSQLSIPEGQGVVVESVREGSTAAAAGLKRHDVILEIDGAKVSSPADIRDRLQRDSKVKAFRSGREQNLEPAPPRKKEF